MEFNDNDQSPLSQDITKNISKEITDLRNAIQQDNDRIMQYTGYLTDRNRNNQDSFLEYLDAIDSYEKQRNENEELLKTKIQEFINHPLNTINTKVRTPSQSGGTKKYRRKNKNKNKNKNKRERTMRR